MVHIFILGVKESVVLWFNIVHILSFISCISPSRLTDPLEQQSVSCQSTVCSMCYDVYSHNMCYVYIQSLYLMIVYNYTEYILCVLSLLFICLPGKDGCYNIIEL